MCYYNQRDHFSYHQLYFFFKQYFQYKAQNKQNLTLAFQSCVLGIGEESSELGKNGAYVNSTNWERLNYSESTSNRQAFSSRALHYI